MGARGARAQGGVIRSGGGGKGLEDRNLGICCEGLGGGGGGLGRNAKLSFNSQTPAYIFLVERERHSSSRGRGGRRRGLGARHTVVFRPCETNNDRKHERKKYSQNKGRGRLPYFCVQVRSNDASPVERTPVFWGLRNRRWEEITPKELVDSLTLISHRGHCVSWARSTGPNSPLWSKIPRGG